MVQITQTEEEIKITIELNRLITRKPDIVLLPTYIKFNNPPIFFERHLAQEIDEMSSFCRIFKNEARLVLVKKEKGIWSELFLKFSKEELMQKRLEIADQMVERNKERDKQAVERYENKRRTEIDKEIRRETAIRERVKQFELNACRDALSDSQSEKQSEEKLFENSSDMNSGIVGTSLCGVSTPAAMSNRLGTPLAPLRSKIVSVSAMRNAGKISVNFSGYTLATPKRESQEGLPRPFVVEDANNLKQDVKPDLTTVQE